MNNFFIGIVDSGLGGYDTYKFLKNKFKNENFILYLDYKNNPYGSKSREEHLKIIDEILLFFKSYNLKYIIIACNTLSNYISYFKSKTDIKVIDIISITLDYLNKKKINNLFIFATKTTILNQKYQSSLIYNSIPIIKEDLVYNIENNELFSIYLNLYKDKIKYKKMNYIFLGCTHYPIIKNIFKKIIKPKKIYDSKKALYNYLKNKLKDNNKKSYTIIKLTINSK